MRAIKTVKQGYEPTPEILSLLEEFRAMVNYCIRVGLRFEKENHATPSMKKLCMLCYNELKGYGAYASYRLTAISRRAGILSARRKSIKRGFMTKTPYASKPLLVSCYNLRVQHGMMRVQLGAKRYQYIPLGAHTLEVLADPSLKVNSFTLTNTSLSISFSKEVEVELSGVRGATGIDRNLRNLTVGNDEKVTYYDVTKIVLIAENTKSVVGSFKRNDVRIRRAISCKYGRRRSERIRQIIHGVTKRIVDGAKANKQAIVFEEMTGIRNLYRKGNGQRRSFRSRMNSWPFQEVKRQVEYKAAWEGVPVITLTKAETRGTTMDCPQCGERLQVPIPGDKEHHRQLWCEKCGRGEIVT
ncbi:MAG: IS200/IS605 family accessory protein TnpB-related protein [Thaumarchaeota archaeon]|nr:IS200/IS605 family accessory protein TnpB-related protein [Nitrososphaerota archaeon]